MGPCDVGIDVKYHSWGALGYAGRPSMYIYHACHIVFLGATGSWGQVVVWEIGPRAGTCASTSTCIRRSGSEDWCVFPSIYTVLSRSASLYLACHLPCFHAVPACTVIYFGQPGNFLSADNLPQAQGLDIARSSSFQVGTALPLRQRRVINEIM